MSIYRCEVCECIKDADHVVVHDTMEMPEWEGEDGLVCDDCHEEWMENHNVSED